MTLVVAFPSETSESHPLGSCTISVLCVRPHMIQHVRRRREECQSIDGVHNCCVYSKAFEMIRSLV